VRYLLFAAFWLLCSYGSAYPILKSKWSKPLVKLGEPVELLVWTEYPAKWQVLFPDSSYSFGSFLCTQYSYSPTFSFDTVSVDTVRYTLVYFELDSAPATAVAVTYYPPGEDSLVRTTDSMRLQLWELLPNPAPDTLQFLATTDSQPVDYAFNLLYWVLGLLACLLVLTAMGMMLAPRMIRHFRKKRLQKRFLQFVQDFEQLFSLSKATLNPEPLEKAYLLWKDMVQEISREPITALSGSEIAQKKGMENLSGVLFDLDIAVYSRKVAPNTPDALRNLREKAYEMLQQKLQELEK
jgi:hypothetical protein